MSENGFSKLGGDNYHFIVQAIPHYYEFERFVASYIPKPPDHGQSFTSLELGTGNGYTLIEALKCLPEESTVVAIDNDASIVFSCWMIHNLQKEQREFLCSEIIRVLKPGGLFINGDKYKNTIEEFHKRDYSKQMELVKEHIPTENLDFWIMHYERDEANAFTETEQDLYMPNGSWSYRFMLDSIFTWKKPEH